MNFRKIGLSLGTMLVATAPIATVIACSSVAGIHQDSIENFGKLTSDTAKRDLEWRWLLSVIQSFGKFKNIKEDQLLKNETIQKLIKFHLAESLRKNANFLVEIAKKLLEVRDDAKIPVFNIGEKNQNDLDFIGMLKKFTDGYDEDFFNQELIIKSNDEDNQKITKTRIELISEILLNERNLDFANEILKHLVVAEYLQLSHEEWKDFRDKQTGNEARLSAKEQLIQKDKNFLLIKKLLEKQLFFKWEVKEQKTSHRFTNEENKTLEDALNEFILSGNSVSEDKKINIIDTDSFNAKRKKLNKGIWDLNDKDSEGFRLTVKMGDKDVEIVIKVHNLLGFQGIVSEKSGEGKLEFGTNRLKELTKDSLIGIIQGKENKKDIVTEDIFLVDEDAEAKDKKANLVFGIGIMPIWDKEKGVLTLEGSRFENNIDSLAWLIYSVDKEVYKEALKFFSDTKEKGGKDIKIIIHNDLLLRHWTETEKLEFVKGK